MSSSPNLPLPLTGSYHYEPGAGEYAITNGLLLANPAATGRQYLSSYEAWQDQYAQRFTTFSGGGELLATTVVLNLFTRSLAPIQSRLFGKNCSVKNAGGFLGSLFLAGATSMAMAGYRRIKDRSERPLAKDWVTSFLYSCPSTILGMGLLRRYSFGATFLQDICLQPFQAILSIGTGISLEMTGMEETADLTVSERLKMELGEGLLYMMVGRQTGVLTQRFLPVTNQQAVPEVPEGLVKVLPHGGITVQTSGGLWQFGLQMWSNKDVLDLYLKNGGRDIPKERIPHLVPLNCVVDLDFVPKTVGLLAADFPQYNFYVTNGTTFNFVAPDAGTAKRLETLLDLAHDGPADPALTQKIRNEYPPDAVGIPDSLREMKEGFRAAPAAARRSIRSFNAEGLFSKDGVIIKKVAPLIYDITDQGEFLGRLDLRKFLPPTAQPSPQTRWRDEALQAARQKVLLEGRPVLWPLGTGHGFALGENTSGFMIWNRGRVILVDPPSNTMEYFAQNGLPLEAIEGVILTHGHTDHYGPAVPELLRSLPKIKVYTTPTIFEMLQEQYQLALGGRQEGLTQWNFVPLLPQRFTEINGLHFRADYAFHVIPTIGFDIYTKPDLKAGRPIVCFSGDTYADPEGIWQHTQPKDNKPPVMNRERAEQIIRHIKALRDSIRTSPPLVVLLEGGIAPIHTPPEGTRKLLDQLGSEGIDTSNVFVYHIGQKAADDAKVPKWQEGHKGLIDLSGHLPDFEPLSPNRVVRQTIDRLPILDFLPPSLKEELLQAGKLRQIGLGEPLMREGEEGRKFYILLDGEVEVSQGLKVIAMRPNGFFGEGAIVGERRNADVYPSMQSLFLEVDCQDLTPYTLNFLQRKFLQKWQTQKEAFTALQKSPLGTLSPPLQDLFFSVGELLTVPKGKNLIRRGAVDRDVYVVLSGEFDVRHGWGFSINRHRQGGMFGEMALVNNTPRSATVTALTEARVLRLPASELEPLMERYPGVAIALRRIADSRS